MSFKKGKAKEEKRIVSGNYKFNLSEIVFAKVRGFPDWPARVTLETNNNRYEVKFFGDNTT